MKVAIRALTLGQIVSRLDDAHTVMKRLRSYRNRCAFTSLERTKRQHETAWGPSGRSSHIAAFNAHDRYIKLLRWAGKIERMTPAEFAQQGFKIKCL